MKLATHPRNQGFVWRGPSASLQRLSEAEAAQYDLQGFVVLEDVFPHDLIDAVTAEIDPIEARVEQFLRTQPDGRLFIARAGEITFSTHLVLQSQGRLGCGSREWPARHS